MKKYILFSIFSSCFLFATTKRKDDQPRLELKSIRNGVVFDVPLKEDKKVETKLNDGKSLTLYQDKQGNKFHSKSDIFIRFKTKISKTRLKEIEKNYSLQLKEINLIGDYRFKNRGEKDTVTLINLIIKKEGQNLIRIYPNKTLNLIKR